MPLPISTFGAFHTIIAITAVIAAFIALARDRRIEPNSSLGKVYLVANTTACLTALTIFRHGGFGPGHVLAVLTLLCMGASIPAGKLKLKHAKKLQTALLSTSLFFSMVPATIETLTRLPPAAPFASSPDDPVAKMTLGGVFALFLIGLVLQLRSRRENTYSGR